MNSEFPEGLRKELLDDFYAECDELLEGVRGGLVELEQAVAEARPTAAVIDGLFRGMHSLKGISAIAGLRPAEQVAHGVEDLLRAVSKNTVALSAEEVDLLHASAQRLEHIVTAHRLEKPLPEIDELLASLRVMSGAGVSADAAERLAGHETFEAKSDPADPVEAARARGLSAWRCIFVPTPELDRRGINLGVVRERLGEIGEIFAATPNIRPNASIEFVFVVGVREPPAKAAAWAADGMTMEPIAVAEDRGSRAEKPGLQEGRRGALSLTPSHIVRVDLARLDDLMRITGEMVIQRSRLEERINQNRNEDGRLKEVSLALARSMRDLRKAISRVRLVPIAEIFTRMPYAVRDLARESEKKVRVVLEGGQTEIDKYLVERLKEPLLHLVRNAFSHGIEPPAERIAAGKPPEAIITLRATSMGELVQIQVRDDGRGVDAAEIAARARALGLTVPSRWDENAMLNVLCQPGFSTRREADMAAGRGVGMDIVATAVRELGGLLTFATNVGRGSEFTLRLPLTLSIAETLIVAVGDELAAVPQASVNEIVQMPATDVRVINRTEVLPYRGGLLPLVRLRPMFGLGETPAAMLTLLVVASERGATGLVVDRVRGQREVVVRPLADPLVRVPGFSGATELGDGRPVLILDPIELTKGVVRPTENGDGASPEEASEMSRV